MFTIKRSYKANRPRKCGKGRTKRFYRFAALIGSFMSQEEAIHKAAKLAKAYRNSRFQVIGLDA